jgi:hypothetical protein
VYNRLPLFIIPEQAEEFMSHEDHLLDASVEEKTFGKEDDRKCDFEGKGRGLLHL